MFRHAKFKIFSLENRFNVQFFNKYGHKTKPCPKTGQNSALCPVFGQYWTKKTCRTEHTLEFISLYLRAIASI